MSDQEKAQEPLPPAAGSAVPEWAMRASRSAWRVNGPRTVEALAQFIYRESLKAPQDEPRTRTLLRAMLGAFDAGDSEGYWNSFEQLLAVHAEMMDSPNAEISDGGTLGKPQPQSESRRSPASIG